MQLAFQMLGFHVLLPGQHLVGIAADSVNLTVVYHQTVRMGTFPAGIGIGGETGVYHGNGGFVIFTLQICEEGTQLAYQEHSFIYDRSAGKRNYIGIIGRLLEDTSCNIKSAVKGQTFFHIGRLFHESLHDIGHALYCLMSQHIGEGRHFTPAEEFHSFFFHNDLEHLLRLVAAQLFLREEEHADTVFSLSADIHAQSLCDSCKKFVGDLGQNTDTVTGLTFRILTGSVLQIFYDLQRILNGSAAFLSVNIDTGSDTAVIMLKFFPI